MAVRHAWFDVWGEAGGRRRRVSWTSRERSRQSPMTVIEVSREVAEVSVEVWSASHQSWRIGIEVHRPVA